MKLYEMFFPPKCIACGTLLKEGADDCPFCEHCRAKWELSKQNAFAVNKGQPIRYFQSGEGENSGAVMFCVYYEPEHRDGVQSRLLLGLKNKYERRISAFCAWELSAMIAANVPFLSDRKDIVITWIPRNISAVKRHGFDHMQRVAKRISKMLDVPCKKLIRRRYFAKEQKSLGAKARRLNAYASMTLGPSGSLKGRTVILIDDIITTGASLNAAAEILVKAGASQIIAAVLGSTAREQGDRYLLENGFNIIKKAKK